MSYPPEYTADLSIEQTETTRGVMATLGLAAVGFVFASPVLLAGAMIPLCYTGATAFTGEPETSIAVRRELSVGSSVQTEDDGAISGDPGDLVEVKTTVRNTGSKPVVDLRVIDGVPDALPVADGSPRKCVTVRSGEKTTLEYSVELQRGEHTFTAPHIRTRDLTGMTRADWQAPGAGKQTVVCSPAVAEAPISGGQNEHAGEVPTDEGGSGIEFHSIREYEPGDPVRSIDWRRYANSRELASIEYRAERSTRILCIVDAREIQRSAPTDSELSVLELTADAAERTARKLLREGHPTGVACAYREKVRLVSPGIDESMEGRIRTLLESTVTNSHPGDATRILTEQPERSIPRVIPGETQLYLFSSFTDERSQTLLEQLRSRGFDVCVVSPDVTGEMATPDTADPSPVARQLTSIKQDNYLSRARATGAEVLEWQLDEPLGPVLDRAVGGVN